ncbi:MAG: tetratricopeptide repeat protein [Candidatus Aminicenantales bacterium]
MTKTRNKSLALAGIVLMACVPLFGQTEDATRILDLANGGVVALVIYGADKAEVAKSSAMALGADILATSYHAISQAYDVEALTSKGKKIKVEGIVAVDKAHDVALLKLKGKVQPLNVSVAGQQPLTAGARLFALGSNDSGQVNVSEGTLRRFVDIGPQEKVMELSLATTDQGSGGPLLDLSGQVVGMLIVFDRGVRVGLPADVIQKISRSGKVADFKSWNREDYFSFFEGASFGGRVAAALDEMGSARTRLEKAVKLNSSFTEGLWLLAGIYDKQRDYPAAIEAYQKVAALNPSRAEAFFGLGLVLKRTSRHQEAVDALEKAIALNINTKEVFFELGDTYEAMQDWAKAADAYEKYLAAKPEVTWNGYLRLGLCRTRLQQYDAAIAAFLAAQKSQPKDLKVNFSLAEAYEKAGQLEKAEEVYNNLAQINPGEARSYYTQALRIYNAAGRFDKAIGPAKKIVELEPKNEMNVYNLGLMYFQLKNYNEAIAAFKQCLAIKPDVPNAWFQIGSAYLNEKMYKEAIDAFKKFTAMSPDEPGGWLSMGVCYMYLKNFEGALEPIRKAVDLKPDNANAQFNLAIVYINLKDNLSAREVYKKLATLDPGLAEKLKKFLK